MEKISDTVWEVVIPKLKQFDLYKYSIETQNGQILEKSDPYAVHLKLVPVRLPNCLKAVISGKMPHGCSSEKMDSIQRTHEYL